VGLLDKAQVPELPWQVGDGGHHPSCGKWPLESTPCLGGRHPSPYSFSSAITEGSNAGS